MEVRAVNLSAPCAFPAPLRLNFRLHNPLEDKLFSPVHLYILIFIIPNHPPSHYLRSSGLPVVRHSSFFFAVCILSVFVSDKGRAQSPTQAPDSICVKSGILVVLKDSLYVTVHDTVIPVDSRFVRLRIDPYARTKSFYDSLLVKAQRRGLKKELHRLFIRDNAPTVTARRNETRREDDFKPFAGKVIRRISTSRVPMLDGNVNDTSGSALQGWNRWVNIHPQTPSWVARGKGIIREGELLVPGALADHERLIRELPSIRDARLYVSPVDGSDSVDIVVVTQDVFPIRLNIDYRNPEAMRIRLNDRNITGTGLETGLEYNSLNTRENKPELAFSLNQYNLFNRFFDASAVLRWNDTVSSTSFAINRDFRSGALSYIGGVELAALQAKNRLDDDALQVRQPSDSRRIDIWYGHVFSNASLEWSFIPSLAHGEIVQKAESDWRSGDRSTLYSLTVIRRSYLRSTLVRKYGTSEYIPVGFSMQYTAGPLRDDFGNSWYTGAAVEWARYTDDVGYLALSWKGGYHAANGERVDRTGLFGWNYYTPLLRIGRVRWRQFAEVRYSFVNDPVRTSLFSTSGPWSDSRGAAPSGDNLWHGGFRSVFFMPWYVYGFRFALYGGAEIYRIIHPFNSGTTGVYPVFQAGVRMQNDFLTYGDYSFQFAYAPATASYPAYWSISFKTFSLPLFDGLKVGKPSTQIE